MDSCFLLENICFGKISSKSDGSRATWEKLDKKEGTCLGAARAGGGGKVGRNVGRKAGQMEKPNRSREDGERIKAGNLRVLMSWWWLDQLAYLWPWRSVGYRTTKQFTPLFVEMAKNLSGRDVSRTRLAGELILPDGTAATIFTVRPTLFGKRLNLHSLPQTSVGPASSAVGLRDSPGDSRLISAGIYLSEPASPLAFQWEIPYVARSPDCISGKMALSYFPCNVRSWDSKK